jgi:Arc/MetJ-type ribon-helix-helix transcriptional regulator
MFIIYNLYKNLTIQLIRISMKVNRDKKTAFTSVSIPTVLFKKVEKHVSSTGFPSVSSYVAFILRTLLSEKGNKKADYETDIIKERLKELGYL